MSSLFHAEAEPEFQPSSESGPVAASASTAAFGTSAEVELALRKFWEVVRSSAETIVTLRQEVATLRSQNATLAAQTPAVEEAEGRIQQLEGALATSEQLNQQLEADVTTARARIAELESALEDGRAAQLQMREEVSETLQHLDMDLATANHQRSLLEQELAGMNLRVAELEARIDERNEQLQSSTETTVRYEILEREKEELEQRIERLGKRLSDLEGVIDDKTQRIEALTADLSSARRDVVEFELQLSSRDAELQALNEQCSVLQERIVTLSEQATEHLLRAEAAQPPAIINDGPADDLVIEWHEERERLIAEAADLQGQLHRALSIIETYRAAGLRHLEDPHQRNQMMLFAGEPLPPQTEQAHQNGTVEPAFTGQVFMTEDELLAISARLDELAGRVEELLGIS